MIDFTDARVIITGGAGSVGQALVSGFRSLGATVVACDRDADGLTTLESDESHAFDLADRDATRQAATRILEAGVPDVVISNAGWTLAETLAQLDERAFDDEMDANFRGATLFTQALLPAMRSRRSGAFVFIASVNALAHFGNPAYSAAKAALLAWMRALATEEGRHGIRANGIAPGSIHTGLWDHRIARDPDILEKIRRLYPIGRMVEPREVAQAAMFLASSSASGISGVTLPVDGGLTGGNLPFLRLIE